MKNLLLIFVISISCQSCFEDEAIPKDCNSNLFQNSSSQKIDSSFSNKIAKVIIEDEEGYVLLNYSQYLDSSSEYLASNNIDYINNISNRTIAICKSEFPESPKMYSRWVISFGYYHSTHALQKSRICNASNRPNLDCWFKKVKVNSLKRFEKTSN